MRKTIISKTSNQKVQLFFFFFYGGSCFFSSYCVFLCFFVFFLCVFFFFFGGGVKLFNRSTSHYILATSVFFLINEKMHLLGSYFFARVALRKTTFNKNEQN